MRRPLKQYAVALYDAVKTPNAKLSDVVSNFTKLLYQESVLSKVEKIFSLFRAYWNTVEREVDVMITSARPVSSVQQKHIGAAVIKTIGAEKYEVHTVNDPSLLGGVVVRYNDTILDGSVRRQLSQIKTALEE